MDTFHRDALVMILVPVLIVSAFAFLNTGVPLPSQPLPLQTRVFQVVDSNVTVTGLASAAPCAVLLASGCSINSTLPGAILIRYGGTLYYAYNLTAPSAGSSTGGATAAATYTMWFTNSTVYCISPAHPLSRLLSEFPTCPTEPYHAVTIAISEPTASAANSTLGLRLDLDLTANPDGSVNVTVAEFNTLPTVNNVTAAGDWPITPVDMFRWEGGSSCGVPVNLPVGYAMFQGHYALDQLRNMTPLVLYAYPLVVCPYQSASPYYAFAPKSDVAGTYLYGDIPSLAGRYNSTADTACQYAPGNGCIWSLIGPNSGYWTGIGSQYGAGSGVAGGACPASDQNSTSGSGTCPLTFTRFPPGEYTVLAADEWGQTVILYFTVQWSYYICAGGPPLCQGTYAP